jgi:peptidoglycan/LPS O-acetylase OafA/YrhL
LIYRAEIDGLRALAVIAVVLFHAGLESFEGGFVGVDVFFVISGYLITTILIEDIESNRFSFVEFYERRSRRILPALFFMMVVCIPFSWFWMLPNQMKDFSQSILAVSLFVSNVLFWLESGYFDGALDHKPLLHTWSLAVEAQFYLVFPIFLYAIWRFGKNYVFWIIVFVSAVSLFFSEWGARHMPSANFYLAPSRLWELLAGSITAFFLQRSGVRNNNYLSLIGITAIFASIFLYDNTTPFPSFYGLVPVVGTVLLIIFASKETVVAKLLRTRVFVGLGLISYSTYLWHQPLLAFVKILDVNDSYIRFLAVILALVLGWFSWRFVEKPFRVKMKVSRTNFFGLTFGFVCFFSVFGLVGHLTNGFDMRVAKNTLNLIKFSDRQNEITYAACAPITKFRKDDRCVLGDKNNIVGALIGDSHSIMLWEPLNKRLKKLGIGVYSLSGAGCPPVLDLYRRDRHNSCARSNLESYKFVRQNHNIEFVILSARWTLYIERERFNNQEGGVEMGTDVFVDIIQDGVEQVNNETVRKIRVLEAINNSIHNLSQFGKKIYVVYPVPEVGFKPNERLAKNLHFERNLSITHSYDTFLYRNRIVRGMFDKIRSSDGSIKFFDVSELICNKLTRRCKTVLETGELLYADDNHLSDVGSDFIVDDIIDWISDTFEFSR